MKIPALIVMGANLAVQVVQKLRRRLSCFCHEVKKIKTSKYGIPLRDMSTKAISAAFFPADDSVLLHHQWSDISEAHGGFINRCTEQLPQPRKHHGRSERPHHATPFATDFQEIETKQGKHLMLG